MNKIVDSGGRKVGREGGRRKVGREGGRRYVRREMSNLGTELVNCFGGKPPPS